MKTNFIEYKNGRINLDNLVNIEVHELPPIPMPRVITVPLNSKSKSIPDLPKDEDKFWPRQGGDYQIRLYSIVSKEYNSLLRGTKEECNGFLEDLKEQFSFLSYKNGILNLKNVFWIESIEINKENNKWKVQAYGINSLIFTIFEGTEKECSNYLSNINYNNFIQDFKIEKPRR